jgi:hypothetical protein
MQPGEHPGHRASTRTAIKLHRPLTHASRVLTPPARSFGLSSPGPPRVARDIAAAGGQALGAFLFSGGSLLPPRNPMSRRYRFFNTQGCSLLYTHPRMAVAKPACAPRRGRSSSGTTRLQDSSSSSPASAPSRHEESASNHTANTIRDVIADGPRERQTSADMQARKCEQISPKEFVRASWNWASAQQKAQ